MTNGTINPNARGLGGDAQGPAFMDAGETESAQEKLKRKKPRVALSCAQCTKVSRSVRLEDGADGAAEKAKV
jgi:hypothetical protein